MITNLLLFVSFLGASFLLGQAATAASTRRRQAIRVKIQDRRR